MAIQLTADGTHTILSEKFNVSYHSIHGALQETDHVFIKAGLDYVLNDKRDLRILEVGFGTGLNVLASLAHNRKSDYTVDLHTIEAYPIHPDQAIKLNYEEFITEIGQEDIDALHALIWDQKHQIDSRFSFTKYLTTLELFETELKFDLIYFDAFAPTAQPELWSPAILQKLYNSLNTKGCLVTYCAKGQVKRDLKSVGFEVQSIPGPPRKREMTRAIRIT